MFLIFFAFINLRSSTLAQCQNGRLIGSSVTPAERNDIVNAHNELREKVATGQVPTQPSAKDMMLVSWDSRLQASAQNWANRCVYAHSDEFKAGERIGQNLYREEMFGSIDTSLFLSPRQIVQRWFDEVNLGYYGVFTAATGHFSQIIWGRTTRIGCGMATYVTRTNSVVRFFVCYYFVAGNVNGELPYTYGEPPCSAPGRSLVPSAAYPGLCISN